MNLFKKVDDKEYAWILYFLLNGIPFDEESLKTERADMGLGVFIEKAFVSGMGLNLIEEKKKIMLYQNLQVFTKEIELSLLCKDKYLYHYFPKKDRLEINDIDVVGSYIYISENDVCTPVEIPSGTISNNSYFKNFKEFVLTGHTVADDYTCDYKDEDFKIICDSLNLTILRIGGVHMNVTYPFVLYILKNLQRDDMVEEFYEIEKIERIYN